MSSSTITRERHGRGFRYFQYGQPVTDNTKLEYVKRLAVPPAWRDVSIASSAKAKILARGTDAAGRQQAMYNPTFRARQDKAKFDRILRFGQRLPGLRRQVEKDLARRKLSREKVLACVVKLMDQAYFRVGNQQYAKENGHYGVTTLRSKHAGITTTSVTFDFIGKSGKHQHKRIDDRQLARIIKQLDELPGHEIFRYLDEDGAIHDINSSDVNAYIKQQMGDDYSAKDFRTWGGTLLASAELGAIERARNEHQLKKIINGCVRNVAEQLGNTPAVTRSSYIDPRIITAYETGDSLSKVYGTIATMRPRKYLKPEERCLLKLLSRP